MYARLIPALLSLTSTASAGPAQDLTEIERAFADWSGARLVFAADELAPGGWFEILAPIPEIDRAAAAEIALAQARLYPRGALGDAGLEVVALFAAVGSTHDDGYHEWDASIGGYLYYGMWNQRDAVAAAWYTDRQLPLTLHHEIFHHLDAQTGWDDDDARFAQAVAGQAPYAAPEIPGDDLEALRGIARGAVLEGAVSDYAAKHPSEDQADTARYLMSHLPSALIQIAEHPELPGSQRLLHVLDQIQRADARADVGWFVDVALSPPDEPAMGREAPPPDVAPFPEAVAGDLAGWVAVDGEFVIYGQEDDDGVNWTLRANLEAAAAAVPRAETPEQARDLLADLALVARYHGWMGGDWTITPGTRAGFEALSDALIVALPPSWAPAAEALALASLEDLAAILPAVAADPEPASAAVRAIAARGLPANPYLERVDEILELADMGGWAETIRGAQPAAAAVAPAGGGRASGVNLSPDGLILTAAHVADAEGRRARVQFPDGRVIDGRCVALDAEHDLALIALETDLLLPFAALAPAAPQAGDPVVIVGQPGAHTPRGQPTNYPRFDVSEGQIRGFLDDPLGDQSLGRTKHDAWTYWGHSGSPLFDASGQIVAMHNSWDPETAMRHAVTWQAIDAFLNESGLFDESQRGD